MSEQRYADGAVVVHHGDALDVLRGLAGASADAVVTDPPYELGFMGRAWDASGIAYSVDLWREVLRVLKPGGHLLAFGGTRTVHRLACAIEDAGFEIRDGIDWLYASGFPKSLDVSKAIDRQRNDGTAVRRVTAFVADARRRAGVSHKTIDDAFGTVRMANHWMTQGKPACVPSWEQWGRLRELLGFGDDMDAEVWRLNGRKGTPGEAWLGAEVLRTETRSHAPSGLVGVGQEHRNTRGTREIKAPATDDARQWSGWGTALKPAREPIVVARKPLSGTVAATVVAHGTGALNIDGCRVAASRRPQRTATFNGYEGDTYGTGQSVGLATGTTDAGRWPSNVVLSHAPHCEACACGWVGPLDDVDNPHEWGDDCRPHLDCVEGCPVAELDRQSGVLTSGANPTRRGSDKFRDAYGEFAGQAECAPARGADSGGASRFFPVFRYPARWNGPTCQMCSGTGIAQMTPDDGVPRLAHCPACNGHGRESSELPAFRYEAKAPASERPRDGQTAHPTVKPLDLMRWLVRLVTPPGGLVLDLFAGSGTTGEACAVEGFSCVLIEREADYLPLIAARLSKALQPALFGGDGS